MLATSFEVAIIPTLSAVRKGGVYRTLTVDRHPAHKAAAVTRWLKANADRIRMHFLPGYSPELNPDELLNQDVKTNALGRRRPGTCST